MMRSRKHTKRLQPFLLKAFVTALLIAAGFLSWRVYSVSYQAYQAKEIISSLDVQLNTLAQKSGDLETLIQQLQDKGVIEKEARLQLNYVKEGEKAVIITGARASSGSSGDVVDNATSTQSWLSQNPKKWFTMLFSHPSN